MLNPSSPLQRLMDAPMRPGRIEWIGLRPRRHAPVTPCSHAILDPVHGLVGDHYSSKTTGSRHVTLIEREQLAAIASYLGRDEIAPDTVRRNIVISGLNLLALKQKHFQLGTALLEMTAECHPCSRMEETFGTGGYNALRGRGGITARVLRGGEIYLQDQLVIITNAHGIASEA
jgi:MOSC domain-containing protein YiiM